MLSALETNVRLEIGFKLNVAFNFKVLSPYNKEPKSEKKEKKEKKEPKTEKKEKK